MLLKDVYYGFELDRLEEGSRTFQHWLAAAGKDHELDDEHLDWPSLYQTVRSFFDRRYEGGFDGSITAGDGLAIATFMAIVRPRKMVEIGAASGFSASFIIDSARSLGLLTDGETYLDSLDVVARRADTGDVTGQLLRGSFPEYEHFWRLHAPATSLDLIKGRLELPISDGPILAFVDGGHDHPWPVVDIVALRQILPPGSWILMQDVQMMERWIADCILYGVPSPPPTRGVQLATTLWPGTKWIGTDICYNMAALRLDADDAAFATYVTNALYHADEVPFVDHQLVLQHAGAVEG
jgi:hypothetical protein